MRYSSLIPVLRKKAKKFESQAFQKNQTSFTHLPDLDLILNDVYHVHYPKPVDYINRRDLVRILNTMAKEIYGNILFLPHQCYGLQFAYISRKMNTT